MAHDPTHPQVLATGKGSGYDPKATVTVMNVTVQVVAVLTEEGSAQPPSNHRTTAVVRLPAVVRLLDGYADHS